MNRILSLLPSTTEIVYALGAGYMLVGVTHECDFPAEAFTKPRVTSAKINANMPSGEIDALVREQLDDSGTLYKLDMDLVRTLRPDLVLTQQLCTVCAVGYETVRHAMRTLEEPPEVMNIEPSSLADVFDSFRNIGNLLGHAKQAEALITDLQKRLSIIPKLNPPPRVLFLEWLIPPFCAGHWIPELVEAAGGIPVLANKGTYSQQLSWEKIMDTDFDVLVISCCGFGVERTTQDVLSSSELSQLRLQRPNLHTIICDGNHYFSRPGPRLVDSAELLHDEIVRRVEDDGGLRIG